MKVTAASSHWKRFVLLSLLLSVVIASAVVVYGFGLNEREQTDFRYEPGETPEDRRPGYERASYIAIAKAPSNFTTLDTIVVYSPTDLLACIPFNIQAVGFDRNGDDPGVAIDEWISVDDVADVSYEEVRENSFVYTVRFVTGERRHRSPLSINASDEFVLSVADCVTNPSTAGWYRNHVYVNGTGPNGNYKQTNITSRYFWICNCSNKAEVYLRVGPKPSDRPIIVAFFALVAVTLLYWRTG